jgi:hypothetical protein
MVIYVKKDPCSLDFASPSSVSHPVPRLIGSCPASHVTSQVLLRCGYLTRLIYLFIAPSPGSDRTAGLTS